MKYGTEPTCRSIVFIAEYFHSVKMNFSNLPSDACTLRCNLRRLKCWKENIDKIYFKNQVIRIGFEKCYFQILT